MPFIRNWTNVVALSEGNIVGPADSDVSTSGWLENRVRATLSNLRRMAGQAVGLARRAVHKFL
jgi:hypothetical protein